MRALSVKSKIALVVMLCTVALTSIVFLAMLGAVDKANVAATESKLYAANAGVGVNLTVEDGLVVATDDDVFVRRGTFSAVYDEKGHFLCGHMPSAKLDKLPYSEGPLRHYSSWVILDTSYNVAGFGEVYIRSVADSKIMAGLITRLKMLAALALAAIAILTVLATMLILRRFFKPIDRMVATAQSIAGGTDLSQRIELCRSKDEFYRLGSSFNEMMDRLESSFEQERRFTNNASHELRTPISVILNESEMALEEGRSQEELTTSMAKIHGQAAHMSALVSQLLMMARADRGAASIDREKLDLSELMELVSETGEELAGERGISVTTNIQPDVFVSGDKSLLMRMALNLVENAVRYGRDGGHIEASLHVEGNSAVGQVKDDGIGISAQDLPHIWERFYQADSARSGSDRGNGLGLSLVEFVARVHGGSVSCASELGQGSAFTFVLPADVSAG